MNHRPIRRAALAGALSLAIAFGSGARAQSTVSDASALSALPIAVSVAASAWARESHRPTSPSTTIPTRSVSAIASKPSRSTRCFDGSNARAWAMPPK
jgi:hypothetical protein